MGGEGFVDLTSRRIYTSLPHPRVNFVRTDTARALHPFPPYSMDPGTVIIPPPLFLGKERGVAELLPDGMHKLDIHYFSSLHLPICHVGVQILCLYEERKGGKSTKV